MTSRRCLLTTFLLAALPVAAQAQTTADGLQAYWTETARTIVEGDFEAYARLYDEDAVLVSAPEGASYSIAKALDGWKYLFDDTRSGAAAARFEVRISRTLSDVTTAHQTGIFHYMFVPSQGEPRDVKIHFEVLFVKKDRWLSLMEYQKGPATEEEWEALR